MISALGQACKRWGFFHIINHPISYELDREMEANMKSFFALSTEHKHTIKRTRTNSRGFADDELTKQKKDLKEIFDFGHIINNNFPPNHEINHVLDGYNQWLSEDHCPGLPGLSGLSGLLYSHILIILSLYIYIYI